MAITMPCLEPSLCVCAPDLDPQSPAIFVSGPCWGTGIEMLGKAWGPKGWGNGGLEVDCA